MNVQIIVYLAEISATLSTQNWMGADEGWAPGAARPRAGLPVARLLRDWSEIPPRREVLPSHRGDPGTGGHHKREWVGTIKENGWAPLKGKGGHR
jgi:hypothetical protein